MRNLKEVQIKKVVLKCLYNLQNSIDILNEV
jgi:hypothetical protein